MNFLYPAFLFALTAVAIPILIHLFSFRRFTTVYFSNVNYLRNIQKESRKKSRLKHLLMLLARILVIICLVFAFAQPYMPSGNQQALKEQQIVSVYIDNSFSMSALSTGGSLLEIARNKALEITGTYPAGTYFRLVTNDMQPKHQHLFNKEQFIQQISEVQPSPRTVPLSLISSRIRSGYTYPPEQYGTTTWFISDFQTISTDLQNLEADSLFPHYFIPLTPNIISNLYIDTCWMELPAHKLGQEELLNVKIVNQSDENYQNLPVKFYLNDTLKALANFDISARSETIVGLRYKNLTAGLMSGYVEISDYPIIHDNVYFLSYKVQPVLKALAVYSPSFGDKGGIPWLRALFREDDYVALDEMNVENLIISKISEYNAIFLLNAGEISSGLGSELLKAAESGSTVIFFPEPGGNLLSYNEFLSRFNANRIERFDTAQQYLGGIEWTHPVYSRVFREKTTDIDFPSVSGHFLFSPAVRISEIPLLWFRNGAKALSTQSVGRGNLVVSAFPLSARNENFARHILFVPTAYSLVINSLPFQKLACVIGHDTHFTLPGIPGKEITSWSVVTPDGRESFIPPVSVSDENSLRINLTDKFIRSGTYGVMTGSETVAQISMNYDRRESDLRFYTFSALKEEAMKYNLRHVHVIQNQEGRFSDVYGEMTSGKGIWKWFILLALAFIAAEAAIAKFWK